MILFAGSLSQSTAFIPTGAVTIHNIASSKSSFIMQFDTTEGQAYSQECITFSAWAFNTAPQNYGTDTSAIYTGSTITTLYTKTYQW
jgi:hypothetical protein